MYVNLLIISIAPNPPNITAVVNISSSIVRVTWTRPTMPNGIITMYTIMYTVDGGDDQSVNVVAQVSTIISCSCGYYYYYNNRCYLMTLLDYLLFNWSQ